jgi:hypothetical protein
MAGPWILSRLVSGKDCHEKQARRVDLTLSFILQQLSTEVTKQMKEEITSAPAEGVYIAGLHLEGAAFDRRSGRSGRQRAQSFIVLHILTQFFLTTGFRRVFPR